MHFEILVEDQSGKIMLETLIPKILGAKHSFRIHSYKGIGKIPRNLAASPDPKKRLLLNHLPKILCGYGKAHQNMDSAVVVVVDLDNRDCHQFKSELVNILNQCNPKPKTLFRIAIEEGEAWLLGDPIAVRRAYPHVKNHVISSYNQDSICDTWEKLADAIYPGGSLKLKKLGYPTIGQIKCEWAENISKYVNISLNRSKSFQVFRDGIKHLAGIM